MYEAQGEPGVHEAEVELDEGRLTHPLGGLQHPRPHVQKLLGFTARGADHRVRPSELPELLCHGDDVGVRGVGKWTLSRICFQVPEYLEEEVKR